MSGTDEQYDTGTLWKQDRDHYIHPWTDFSTFKQEGSLVLAESEGAYVYDSDGNRYLDGIGGLWCVNIGYGNEEMAQAIAEQVRRIPYYSTFTHLTTPPAAELAAKLAELTPGSLNHVFYGTGGSMSNDTAIRIIHFYFNRLGRKKKKKIISRIDGYHGSTYLAMSMTGVKFDHQGFDLAPDLVHHIPSPNTYRRPDGMSEDEFCREKAADLENKILELGAENVACFIAEPIMGAGGVIVPPKGYHRLTREICDKYEVLYISDEVVTGFGRLGHFFASEAVFNFEPDVITCAKGISSGYLPLSATLLSQDIYEVISVPQAEGALFTHGFTYSGHPVACAAGMKNEKRETFQESASAAFRQRSKRSFSRPSLPPCRQRIRYMRAKLSSPCRISRMACLCSSTCWTTAALAGISSLSSAGVGRTTSCRCRTWVSVSWCVSSVFKGMFMSVFPFPCVRIKKAPAGLPVGAFWSPVAAWVACRAAFLVVFGR